MRKKVGFSTVPKSSPLNQFPSWKCGIGMQNSWYSSPTTSRIKSARSCGRAAPHLADFAPGGQTVPHWGRLIATKLKWKKNNTLSISSHLHPYLTMWYYVYYICSIRPLYIYILLYIYYTRYDIHLRTEQSICMWLFQEAHIYWLFLSHPTPHSTHTSPGESTFAVSCCALAWWHGSATRGTNTSHRANPPRGPRVLIG